MKELLLAWTDGGGGGGVIKRPDDRQITRKGRSFGGGSMAIEVGVQTIRVIMVQG